MNERHIVPICSVSSIDKCDIWKLLCELDLGAWGYEVEVDMAITISGVLKSPEILTSKYRRKPPRTEFS